MFLGFVDFVVFMVFAFLGKHKIKTSGKGKHVFVVFGFFDFFCVFFVFQDIGNDMYMQEGICACEEKHACVGSDIYVQEVVDICKMIS